MASNDNFLTFGKGNGKLKHTAEYLGYKKSQVLVFSLPAGGASCPAANLCHSQTLIDEKTGKRHIVDFGQFRCYATKAEALYTNVYNSRHKNRDMIKSLLQEDDSIDKIATLIVDSIRKTSKNAKLIRIHDSGDFFHKRYFLAWVKVAQMLPEIKFFAYTKIVQYAVKSQELDLDNFKVQYSYGGMLDSLRDKKFNDLPTCYVITDKDWMVNQEETMAINKHDGRSCKIVCNNESGHDKGHEDCIAIFAGESFGILFH